MQQLLIYTAHQVGVLPCYSFFVYIFVRVCCVFAGECINLLLLLKFKFSSLFALAARERRHRFMRLEMIFLTFTAIKFLPIKHFPLGACQCFDLEYLTRINEAYFDHLIRWNFSISSRETRRLMAFIVKIDLG
jgi:hypothetical protein